MAEINYNNLYNQLSPMEQRYYDQQFSKNYVPGQENIMLSSQPAYEQMKAAYEAQQQIPEKSFFDFLNPFSSASAAEKPTVPNLSLGYNMPTFDLGTGITNTTAASPFINTADILNKYNVPNLRSQDLINQLVEQNRQKVVSDFINAPQDYYPSDLGFINAPQDYYPTDTGGITNIDLPYSGIGSMRYETPRTIADQNRVLGQTFTEKKPSGIEKLLSYVMPGSFVGDILAGILPKDSPQVGAAKDFYRNQYGLTSSGSVASGIMQGYNPVSGGFLNMITGGRYGDPMNIGLQRAYQKRINMISKNLDKGIYKDPATKRKQLAELQKLKRQEQMAMEKPTIDRARQAAPDVYRDAGDRGTLGPGGGFSTSGREGAFSSKSGRGRQDF